MIRIVNTEVYGFRKALSGMRNPKESWPLNDSQFHANTKNWGIHNCAGVYAHEVPERPIIGENDLDLLRRLIIAGSPHRKCLRAIVIWVEIAPNRYTWQEIDTYKVGPVRNSCSTMHKLGTRDLVPGDFQEGDVLPETFKILNDLGKQYRTTKDYSLVKKMKRYMPEGYLQMATYNLNYENALSMFFQRKDHRLEEWAWTGGVHTTNDGRISICDWIYSLPYMEEFIGFITKHELDRIERYREEGRQEERTRLQGRNGEL